VKNQFERNCTEFETISRNSSGLAVKVIHFVRPSIVAAGIPL